MNKNINLILIVFLVNLFLVSCGTSESEILAQKLIAEEDRLFCDGKLTQSPFAGGDGSIENPYSICSVEQFNNISSDNDYLDKYFTLKADLDFASITLLPVGSDTNPFVGEFNGSIYSMKNISLSESNDFVGVFRKLSNPGVIKNIKLLSISITGHGYTGGLVGFGSGKIQNCHSTGSVTGTGNVGGLVGRFWGVTASDNGVFDSSSSAVISGSGFVGGMIGWTRDASYENNFATGDVASSGDRAGGLIGIADQRVTITNSYATGDVTGGQLVGGLVGGIVGDINSSYSTGAVVSRTGYVGGIAGTMNGSLQKSYSSSAITINSNYVAGGLVGYMYAGKVISNSYFIGSINSSLSYIGGLVGYNAGSNINYSFAAPTSLTGSSVGGTNGGTELATSSTSFWNTESSAVATDYIDDGTTTDTTYGKTTSEMKSRSLYIGAGYDETIWNIVDGSYPTLK